MEFNNTQMQTVEQEMYPQEFLPKMQPISEDEQISEMLAQLMTMIPAGFLPENRLLDQYAMVQYIMQYINTLNELKSQQMCNQM